MGKILYIRLDSSPLPEASEDIIVKDFNLESYFCTLLGKRLLEENGIVQTTLFPGKIVSDYKSSSVKSYHAIIKQWDMVLVRLLSDDKERQFTLNIPSSYFEWLSHQEDKIYREIGKTQSMSLSFTKEFLYKELIEFILLKRLECTLKKICDAIDIIVIGLRYSLRFTGEIQLDNYIRPLNRQFEKSSFEHRKNFLVRHPKSRIDEMDFIKFFIKRM